MPTIDFAKTYTPHDRQLEFHNLKNKYRGIGGAMAGGKSRAGCGEIIQRAIDYPGNRLGIFRKNRSTLKRTTLVSFLAVCPPDLIANYNRSELIIDLVGGSQIIFDGVDITKDPTLEKIRSLELGGYFFDEGTEVPEEVFRALAMRITNRWMLPDGSRPEEIGIVSFNPEPGWCEDRFVIHRPTNHSFTQFLMSDNPYIEAKSIEELREILTPEEVKKYIEGMFLHTDDPNQLISYQWINNAIRVEGDLGQGEGALSLGVDVSWLGMDKSVLAICYPNMLERLIVVDKWSTYTLAELVKKVINEYGIAHDRVVIDVVGVGAGVYDNLRATGYRVKAHIGGAASTKRLKSWTFRNMRTQSYWNLRELLRLGEFEIPDHQILKEDLLAQRYTISGDRQIALEKKELLIKRIGRSPDYSDALAMALSHEHIGGSVISSSTFG